MEKIIVKYLRNELLAHEEYELKRWLQESENNRKVFENLVGAWSLTQSDIDASKSRVLKQTALGKLSNETIAPIRIWSYVFKVAAIILLASTFFYTVNNLKPVDNGSIGVVQSTIEKKAERGQKLTIDLPDGTIVKLNSGSVIRYPSQFDQDIRLVELTGEAFFDVVRDENRPFRIATTELKIQVLGTSFSVRSYIDDKDAQIAVKSGSVEVLTQNETSKVILLPNEMVVYGESKGILDKEIFTDRQNPFAWVEMKIVFVDDSIDDILKILSRWYNVDFVLDRKLSTDKKFTAKYNNLSLQSVMGSLSYAYDFEYEIKGKTIVIK